MRRSKLAEGPGIYGNLPAKRFSKHNQKAPVLADTPRSSGPSTLMDVARKAGVSPSTVSRILNGTARVSEDKRLAVLAAIAHMNFAPNQMAQGLKKGRSMTIGIVVQDISSPSSTKPCAALTTVSKAPAMRR
jgi:hypothetical protein